MTANNENIKILIYVGPTWHKGMSEGRAFETADTHSAGTLRGEKSVITPPIWWSFTNEGSTSLACPINRWKDMPSSWHSYKTKWLLKIKYGTLAYITGTSFLNVVSWKILTLLLSSNYIFFYIINHSLKKYHLCLVYILYVCRMITFTFSTSSSPFRINL